jgi:DNA-binding FrmR family transcriptional regulator
VSEGAQWSVTSTTRTICWPGRLGSRARSGVWHGWSRATYCIDVLTQVSATTPALPSVALELLEDHLTHCVTEADGRGGEEAHRKPREASAAIARLVTS